MRNWKPGAVSALMIMMAVSPAWAEPTSHERALKLFNEGVALYDQGDKDRARLTFIEAYKIDRFPDLTWNLAFIQVKTQHWAEAIPVLRAVMADPVNAKRDKRYPKPRKELAAEYIAQVSPYVGRIHVQAPAGSTIYVNDDEAPVEDGAVLANLGTATVRVNGAVQQVAVVKDAVADVDFTKHEPPPPVAQKTPEPLPEPSASTPVVVAKAREQAPASSPPKKDNPFITPAFVVGGGAIVAGVGYVISALEVQSKSHAVLQLYPTLPATGCPSTSGCQTLQSDLNSRKSWSYAQDTLGVASLALVAGAGVFAALAWHSSRGTESSHDATLVPVVAPGFAGFSFARSF